MRRVWAVLAALACAACSADERGRIAGLTAAVGRSAAKGDAGVLVGKPDVEGLLGAPEGEPDRCVEFDQPLVPMQQRRLWDRVGRAIVHDPRYEDLFASEPDLREQREPNSMGLGAAPAVAGSPEIVPLGPDPGTGLQEFAVVGSGVVRLRDPLTGRIPDGERPAIVLVLVPARSPADIPGDRTTGPAITKGDKSYERPETRPSKPRSFLLSREPTTVGQFERLYEHVSGRPTADDEAASEDTGYTGRSVEDLPASRSRRLRAPTVEEWSLAARWLARAYGGSVSSGPIVGLGDTPERVVGETFVDRGGNEVGTALLASWSPGAGGVGSVQTSDVGEQPGPIRMRFAMTFPMASDAETYQRPQETEEK